MSTTQRGAIVLVGLIVVMVVCSWLTFSVLPSAGVAMGVPVIMVPGEPYDPTLPVESFRWTNTLSATVLASLAVIVFAVWARVSSKNWTNEVPSRFQSWVELLGGFMYDFSKQFAGKNARVVFPLVASIFVFLLAVNWMKLLPGYESVGVLHCAEAGFNGYAGQQVGPGAYQLDVRAPLNSGFAAAEEDYEACHEWKDHGAVKPARAEIDQLTDTLRAEETALRTTLERDGLDTAAIDTRIDALRLETAELLYDHARLPLSADQLDAGAIPFHFVVTPYLRGASTDLSLTIALSLIAFFAIQFFGFMAQGPNYLQKFVNLRALGNLGKKPLGAIDFVVGIFEIISELGKIISLSFRLFGNMFAGGILLIVMSFLVGLIIPSLFYGLELILTTIQALVFAILTLIFSAQAMEGHHGDDHDEHADDPHQLEQHTA